MSRMTMNQRREFEQRLFISPQPTFSNIVAWHAYVRRCAESGTVECVNIAIAWCRLVHKVIEDNKVSPERAIEITYLDVAAYFGIHGEAHPNYRSVLSALTQCWVYGKELQEWHRQKFNV